MPRTFLDDWRAGQVLTWSVTRAKCRGDEAGGDKHESVRLVGGQWLGESTGSFECPFADPDPCPRCGTLGYRELSVAESQAAQYDGVTVVHGRARVQCPVCTGLGHVPGPHWPYRWPKPPPLRMEE